MDNAVFAASSRSYSTFPVEARNIVYSVAQTWPTSMLLKTEIDEATAAGRSIEALECEFREVGSWMLGRSQSAEIGNG